MITQLAGCTPHYQRSESAHSKLPLRLLRKPIEVNRHQVRFISIIYLINPVAFYHQYFLLVYPEPDDKEDWIRNQLYVYDYDNVSALPARYTWPKQHTDPEPKLGL